MRRNRPKLPDTVSPKNCPLSIWLSKQKELVSLDKRNVNKNYVYHFSIGTKRDVTRWQTNTERTHTRMDDFYVFQRLGVSRMRKHIKHLVMVSSIDTDIHTYILTLNNLMIDRFPMCSLTLENVKSKREALVSGTADCQTFVTSLSSWVLWLRLGSFTFQW